MVSTNSKRREKDLMKLMMSNYEVTLTEENKNNDFYVIFKGPKDTPYEEGIWKVHVLLPDQYPFKSPSIGFQNKIFHPNVDESSGSVCLDVINQAWSPMFDLLNIFDVFLPQLLHDPNPKDPLNGEAASLLLKDPGKYKSRVKEYVKKYASKDRSNIQQKNVYKENINNNNNLINIVDNLNRKEVHNDTNSIISELSNASDLNSDNEVKN